MNKALLASAIVAGMLAGKSVMANDKPAKDGAETCTEEMKTAHKGKCCAKGKCKAAAAKKAKNACKGSKNACKGDAAAAPAADAAAPAPAPAPGH